MPYIDIESGLLHLDPEITYDNTVSFLATLRQMQQHPAVKGITVHMTAHGGALMPAVAIVQALKTSPVPVSTIGSGLVGSAALPVLAAGSSGRRSIVEGTTLVLHNPTHTMGEASRKSPDIEGWKHEVAFHERIAAQYFWCLERCSGQPAGVWQGLLNGRPTRVLTTDEAMNYGLVDTIVPLRTPQASTSAPV